MPQINSVVLRRIQDRLRRGWCTRFMARNILAEPVWPASSDACSWCLLGALIAEVPDDKEYDEYFYFLNSQVPKIYHNEISDHAAAQFNDASTQDAVVEFVGTLVNQLEEKERLECPKLNQ